MKTISRALFSLFLSAPLVVGCASSEGGEGASAGDSAGGKADDLDDEVNCDDTALDDNQVCRRGNGQFAPSVCCADELACVGATIDEQGKCRSDESGQFVPARCCDELCEGTAVINGFCRNEDSGQFALAACCADQCFDLQPAESSEPPAGSCEGACGEQSPDGDCFCDDICGENEDCCADFGEVCEDAVRGAGAGSLSCAGSCGDSSPSGLCFCDEVCAELGDCCGDKVAQCGGPGVDRIVPCETPDACEGADVDDGGFCRKPDGQFALADCCAPSCGTPNLEELSNGQLRCRNEDSGRFVPTSCCASRCENAGLDRNGICRNSENGEFADPACCNDQCVQALVRGDADRVDACNGTQEAG